MNKNLAFTKTIEINASPKQVWDALTDPAKISSYLFGTLTRSNWEVGSQITFEGVWEGQSYLDKGTILVANKNEELAYTYWSSMSGMEDVDENYITVSFHIEPREDDVLLSLTQKGARDESSLTHSADNWKQVLQGIKKVAEE